VTAIPKRLLRLHIIGLPIKHFPGRNLVRNCSRPSAGLLVRLKLIKISKTPLPLKKLEHYFAMHRSSQRSLFKFCVSCRLSKYVTALYWNHQTCRFLYFMSTLEVCHSRPLCLHPLAPKKTQILETRKGTMSPSIPFRFKSLGVCFRRASVDGCRSLAGGIWDHQSQAPDKRQNPATEHFFSFLREQREVMGNTEEKIKSLELWV